MENDMSTKPKKPYRTPWDGNPEKRLDEDRQWNELSRAVQDGIVSLDEDLVQKIAKRWLRQKLAEVN